MIILLLTYPKSAISNALIALLSFATNKSEGTTYNWLDISEKYGYTLLTRLVWDGSISCVAHVQASATSDERSSRARS